MRESGIDGNCPEWPGASAVYSKAYLLMRVHGANPNLIEALGEGKEERIKSILLYQYSTEELRQATKSGD